MAMPQTAREATRLDRRSFLVATGGVTAGLLVGFGSREAAAAVGDGTFNPFVQISPDGVVTVLCKHLDKGQGTLTGVAICVAEELDADWAQMRGEHAPANAALYGNTLFGGVQGTGGSTGMPDSFMKYRKAGAAARAMLVAAAAREWGVPASEITVANGTVAHASGRSAGFGELAAAASAEPAPEEPALKSPADFRLIGKTGHHRLDTRAKTRGEAIYTQDIFRDGMLVAVLARPTRFGGRVASFDASAALAMPGVREVVETPHGVAVLADTTWQAIQAREALQIDWDDSAAETRSTDAIMAEYVSLLDEPGTAAVDHEDAEAALSGAAKTVEATFEFPFLSHAPMEPMNAVVELTPGEKLEIWSGSQLQTLDQLNVAPIAGVAPEQVKINTVFAGGSFGRRTTPPSDYMVEAVAIAAAIEGRAPVKLVWTREDDIKGGYYRPMVASRVRAGLDANGNIVGWHQRIAVQSILAGTPFREAFDVNGVDGTSIEGAVHLPYALGAHRLEAHDTELAVPILWWRSVGSTHTAYAVETMVDRLAAEAGVDPLEFRLAKMDANPREKAALELAAEKAGWGGTLPEGVTQGVAVHKSFGSYVAQVAELRQNEDGSFKVLRVVCAIDCGIPVYPDQIVAQMEGSIGYGLGAIMRNKITFTDGVVDQFNFTDYEPTRMSDMPDVEVHIVPSAEPPSGVGEPGVPPIGPAVANAIFAATGKRIDRLPMTDSGVSFA
ncbi:MAG: molybdopterin cofactor-binding domain-containing protein [Pseudomonadota bacterium]